jgi:hypothetical protein
MVTIPLIRSENLNRAGASPKIADVLDDRPPAHRRPMASDVDVGLASLRDGTPRHSSARLLTKRAPQAQSDLGDLYLVMQGESDHLCKTFSDALVSSYFSDTTTNIINGLFYGVRQAADQVAVNVRRNDRVETLGATVAVIEGDDLYIAQLPPSQIFILREGVLNALPNQTLPETHPQPEFAPDQEIEIFRVKLDEGDVVALASHDLRHGLTKREIQGLLHGHVAQQAAHDICGLVAQRGGHLCELLVLRIQSQQDADLPNDPFGKPITSTVRTLPPTTSLTNGTTRWESRADTQAVEESRYEQPSSRPGTRRAQTAGQWLASIPLTAVLILLLLPVTTARAIFRLVSGRQSESVSNAVKGGQAEGSNQDPDSLLYDDWESLRSLRETQTGTNPTSQSDAPLGTVGMPISEQRDPFLPRPRKPIPGPGVFIFSLSLVLLLGMGLMYTLRGCTANPPEDPDSGTIAPAEAEGPKAALEKSARKIFEQAQEKYRGALTRQQDEDLLQDDDIKETLLVLAKSENQAREALASSGADSTLRQDVNGLLNAIGKLEDTLTRVVKLVPSATIDKFPNGVGFATGPLAVREESTYVLDAIESRVVEGNFGEADSATVLRKGDRVSSIKIEKPIAIVNRALSVVVIDTNYNLVSLQPNQNPRLLRIVGTGKWRKPVAFDNFNNNLYILDPEAGDLGMIHKYQVTAGGYELEPISYVNQSEEIDLSDAIDLAIDGEIFVLLQNGSILRFSGGRKVPFEINGLFGGKIQATRIFTEVTADSLYLVDPKHERIVEVDKTEGSEGAFIRQFKFAGSDSFFADIRSIWIDEAERKLLVLGKESLRQFVIPTNAS